MASPQNYRPGSLVLAAVGSVIVTSATTWAAVITTNNADGADAGVDFFNQSTNSGSANAINFRLNTTTNNIAYVKFGLQDLAGDLSGATFSFTKTGSNSTNFNVYGLVDGHTGEGWAEDSLTYANAPGIDTANSSSAGITLAPSEVILLGNVAFGTGQLVISLANANVDSFLASDTDGQVTFIVTPTADKGAFFRTREFGTPPTLSLPNVTVVPEPSLLAGVGFAAGVILIRSRAKRRPC